MTSEHQASNVASTRVAILGPLGTYTYEAAHSVFGDSVDYEERKTITDTLHAVKSSVNIGVVPQENTIFGIVIETYDGFRHLADGFIKGEIILPIQHSLLVQRGVELHEIEQVLSHEQALGQCQEFLDKYLPKATRIKTSSTASAAQSLLSSTRNTAAICSKICATLFEGLEVLREGIQRDPVYSIQTLFLDNFTRFYIIARDRDTQIPESPNKLTFKLKHKALLRLSIISPCSTSEVVRKDVVQYLALAGLRVARIDRRPLRDSTPFQDVYFVELEDWKENSPIDPWSAAVNEAVGRIREAGALVDLAGLW